VVNRAASADLYDYALTKAATMNFVKSLAKQLGPKGICVNGVASGPWPTGLRAEDVSLRPFIAKTRLEDGS
jgi:NAD(P)-dependent dehydrogenase (short-subunit alcohol dehydrogenase family)